MYRQCHLAVVNAAYDGANCSVTFATMQPPHSQQQDDNAYTITVIACRCSGSASAELSVAIKYYHLVGK